MLAYEGQGQEDEEETKVKGYPKGKPLSCVPYYFEMTNVTFEVNLNCSFVMLKTLSFFVIR